MNKQIIITIFGIILMMSLVSALTYGSIEQNITIKINETNEDSPDDSSSNGGSSGTIKDWSAKCGYNKQCLAGKINITALENVNIDVVEPEPEETDPIIPEEKKTIPTWLKVLAGIFALLVGFLIWKEFFNKDYENEDIDLIPEHIEISEKEVLE